MNGNYNRKGLSPNSGDGLATAVAKFPTPQSHDANTGCAKKHGWGRQVNLNDLVVCSMWPTPTVQDSRNNAGAAQFRRHSLPLNAACKFPTPKASGGNGPWETTHSPSLNVIVSKFPTTTTHGGSGRKGNMPKFGQLNPDWVEWLMGWMVGWTDLFCENEALVWLDISRDPAVDGRIPRTTDRRKLRRARIRAIGNGQVPQCAAAAFLVCVRFFE